jgi:DNA-directed RNA polymerase sigma subunit (sigma70/sigma32)
VSQLDPLDPFGLRDKISAMHKKNITKEYLACKGSLSLKQRYYDIFEYRQGLADKVWHTLKATGQRFGISGCRVRQIEGRVIYEVEKRIV